jgi:hypothetical protein
VRLRAGAAGHCATATGRRGGSGTGRAEREGGGLTRLAQTSLC